MKTPYLHPAFLQPFFWIVVVAGALLSGLDFYPLSGTFYGYVVTAIACFSVAAMVGAYAGRRFAITERLYERVYDIGRTLSPNRLFAIHVALMIVSLIFQCLDHRLIAGSAWWRPEGLIVYRLAVSEFGLAANYRFTAILNYFFFAMPPLLWLHWNVVRKGWRLTALACLLFFVYLSTARSSFFTMALILGFFILHYRPRIRLAIVASLVLFFAFQFLGSIVGKSDFDAFWIYLFAPMFALDQILQGVRNDLPGTYYSFRFFQPYLAALGFLPGNQSNLLAYYSTPFRTNVYTVFGPYVLDFGTWASLFFVGGFGFVSGVLRGLQQRHPRVPYLVFLCSLSLTLLVLGVFYDYYTGSGYVWFSVLFSTFLFPRTGGPAPDTARRAPSARRVAEARAE